MAALTVRRFLRPFTALAGADKDGILEITLPKAERIQQIGPGARARDPQGAS
jgi:hypothetical protein